MTNKPTDKISPEAEAALLKYFDLPYKPNPNSVWIFPGGIPSGLVDKPSKTKKRKPRRPK